MLIEKSGKNFNPLVSIIIPVYNGERYLREAIDSALNQTYRNIEIIVVNDGSVDGSEEIIKSYGNKLRYFKKENGGVSTALNLGIKESKGEYISWLSHDDVYFPEKIEQQLIELSKQNFSDRERTILMSNFLVINKKSKVTSTNHFENIYDLRNEFDPIYPLLTAIVNGCTLLIPKKCFDKYGYFDPKLKATQDYDLWFKMFPNCKVIFMDKVLVKMRVHKNQGTWKIKNIDSECDDLWIDVIKRINDNQKNTIFGSVEKFYQQMYKTFNEAGYVGAENYLMNDIKKYEEKTGLKMNIEKKQSVSRKEKYYLDKIYLYPMVGEFLIKLYLRTRKLFK